MSGVGALRSSLHAQHRIAKEARAARARQLRDDVLDVMRRHLPEGARAWLFGSLASLEFGVRSDVDIAWQGPWSAGALLALEREVGMAADADVDLLPFDALPASLQDRIRDDGIEVVRG